MTPLVSIVMPSFNQAAFIESSIASVLGQSYPRLELIVADGGSTDGTVEVLQRIQAQDNRLRWLSEPDNGPANALNKAFERVRGTLIGWLNSDDLYTPGAIGRAVTELTGPARYALVYGHGIHVDEHGNELSRYPTLPPSTPYSCFANGCFVCQPTMFFTRSAYQLLGPLDESIKTAFDFEYWLRAFKAYSGRIGFIDKVQACSRLHDDCITLNMRYWVAIEGLEVLHRHMGTAPGHWLLTYFSELMESGAMPPKSETLPVHALKTLEAATPFLDEAELGKIADTLKTHPKYAELGCPPSGQTKLIAPSYVNKVTQIH
ncbi:glycosyltransferase family 2 protein [Gilvimarinus sp. SDUM040013]|uniref:Glycosyltransferase family 2 protein n=1 Tax=Gilvimarinus gilvus TaxID=3058038 RepID=A0ABU4RWI5_9GAMM|nr:glycosyltransferase family 2 protein [Gilvimarinus sp. SDUM040013]MDO3387330.1 glycosyltransferase family 2 protein [Gilvimarinus sp. SDUM040013]MDX6849019.1 glycosyltransferase family 2 protein [Gilvimarinus sp. SDUM040013]